ncbi:MAG: type II CAAX prenyl endopeptidase Rce1 family protein [Gemmatimonadales bacterium]
MSLRRYFKATREPRYSIVFAVPLLLLYEVLAVASSHSAFAGVRNGADVLLKTLFVSLGGRNGLLAFDLLLLGVGGWFVWRDRRHNGGGVDSRVFAGMLAESVFYAAVLGSTVSLLTAWFLGGPLYILQAGSAQISLGSQLIVSLGAGIYEELLFRVLLVGALVAVGTRLNWSRPVSVAVAVLGSALIFSGFHYVGSLGDQFTVPSFTYRAIAGILLSGLYVARGFGITAWSHALYDIGLTLLISPSS